MNVWPFGPSSSFIIHRSSLESRLVKRSLLVALFVLSAVACGKRGDPRPPVPMIPAATSDLVVTQRADRVLLSWSYPALSTAGKNLTGVRRISIFRYEEALPAAPGGRDPKTLMPGDVDPTQAQPVVLFSKIPTIPQAQFAKLSTRIDSIEKANLADATIGARLLFHDTPPFRSSDGRPMRLTYAVVTEGEEARGQLSNLAVIVPLAVGFPPSGLTATPKPEGVTLAWAAPQQAVGNLGAPIVMGYNVYRTAPGTVPGELDVPVNTAPVTATTYTDAPAYGEHEYRVAAVAAMGPPLVQSDLSAAAKVTFRDLVAPPAPATVTPLVEPNAIRLLWDPVEAADLAGYKIYRMEGAGHGNDIKEVGTINLIKDPIKETTWLNKPVSLGLAFKYAVSAVDQSGNESAKTWTDWIVAPKTP